MKPFLETNISFKEHIAKLIESTLIIKANMADFRNRLSDEVGFSYRSTIEIM